MADAQAIKASLAGDAAAEDADTAVLAVVMDTVRQLPDGLSADDEALQSVIDALGDAKAKTETFLR